VFLRGRPTAKVVLRVIDLEGADAQKIDVGIPMLTEHFSGENTRAQALDPERIAAAVSNARQLADVGQKVMFAVQERKARKGKKTYKETTFIGVVPEPLTAKVPIPEGLRDAVPSGEDG
jgi:hypothetical protein